MNHVTISLCPAGISRKIYWKFVGNLPEKINRKSTNFATSINTDIDCILIHNFLILLNFFDS